MFVGIEEPTSLNLYGYILFRRMNNAKLNCAEGEFFPPNKLLCAMIIMAPFKTRQSYFDETKLFKLSQYLENGQSKNQITFLSIPQVFSLGYFYNAFGQFESENSPDHLLIDDLI